MTHPNQQHPRRTEVSRAARKPHLQFRYSQPWALHHPRRWRTGPGPQFPPDPARLSDVAPPHARARSSG